MAGSQTDFPMSLTFDPRTCWPRRWCSCPVGDSWVNTKAWVMYECVRASLFHPPFLSTVVWTETNSSSSQSSSSSPTPNSADCEYLLCFLTPPSSPRTVPNPSAPLRLSLPFVSSDVSPDPWCSQVTQCRSVLPTRVSVFVCLILRGERLPGVNVMLGPVRNFYSGVQSFPRVLRV